MAALRGDLEFARRLLEEEEVVDIQRATGYTQGLRTTLLALAGVASDQGPVVRAAGLLNEGLRLTMDSAPAPHLLLFLEEIAGLVAATQPQTSARLAAAAEAHRATIGVKRRPTEDERFRRSMARASAVCDARAFEQAWAEGSRLTSAQANLEALDLTARLAAPSADPLTSSSPGYG